VNVIDPDGRDAAAAAAALGTGLSIINIPDPTDVITLPVVLGFVAAAWMSGSVDNTALAESIDELGGEEVDTPADAIGGEVLGQKLTPAGEDKIKEEALRQLGWTIREYWRDEEGVKWSVDSKILPEGGKKYRIPAHPSTD